MTGNPRKSRFVTPATFMLASLVISGQAWGDPSLPHLISDRAIFQQGRDIHIWGTADPAEEIEVSLAGKQASTKAGSDGHWSVLLPPMQAGGPFTLEVAGKKTLVIKDVLIGEVWVASGQSNMTFALADSTGADQELPKADYPEIRLFTVPKRVALSPHSDTLPAFWQPCTPATAKDFSAVAYYFARNLHRNLHVPIGIIEAAWPGTAIEEWTAPRAADRDSQIKSILASWNSDQGDHEKAVPQAFDLEFDDFELLKDSTLQSADPLVNFDDGSTSNELGGDTSYDAKEAPDTKFDLSSQGRGGQGFDARVRGVIDASNDSRLATRFHLDDSPADLTGYTGIRFWVRGNGSFRFLSKQPTITDWDDYATQLIHASPEWKPVTIRFRDLHQEGWGVTHDFTPQALTGFAIECIPTNGYPVRPATALYQGMIAPLLSYPFRGAIWYQGEGNGGRPDEYHQMLSALIESWRLASHQPEMQFLTVQLPNHGASTSEPSESAWAQIREAQLQTATSTPGVGLAVTIDLGDPNDLHPHRKAEVGERLALWALGTTYHKSIVYSGPLYQSMAIEGKTIRIRFTQVGSGLVPKGGGPLRGFAIAGPDHKFRWASAVIDHDSVVVSSPEVSNPVAVRYAWADSPEFNLYNADGLPASPFRTDDWALQK